MRAVQKFGTNIFRIMLAVAGTLVAMLLFGCSDDIDISLLRSDISITLGDSRDIRPYVGFSPAVSGGTVELDTSSDCVEIDGTRVTAVKPGVAEVSVTAYGKTVVMTVTVTTRGAEDFSVTAENSVQTAESADCILPVVLSVEFDGYVDPKTTVQWKVGDIEHTGADFTFVPPAYGEYIVSVAADNIQKQCVIKVYRRTEVTVRHSELNNAKAYAPVVFTAYENVNTLNPKSVYAWRVNGKVQCTDRSFTFVPQLGEYTVSLDVNGERKEIDGKSEFALSVTQEDTDLTVDFDDAEGVYIRWAQGRKVKYVSILPPDGKRMIFDVTDAQYSHLFTDGAFRATEYINVCAHEPKSYIVTLGADGEYSELVFNQISAEVQQYLDDKVLCRNSYISSADEARSYVRELYATGKTAAECYAAADVQAVSGAIAEQAKMMGLSVTAVADGSVIKLSFAPYDNAPSKSDTKTVNISYSAVPHIEYDEKARRSTDYVFQSDRYTRKVEVRGAEQLLVAVSGGFRPVTQSGDIAATVYRAAKSVLLRIIGADYTPRQKVHAIYDWVQWVSVEFDTEDSSSASRFLEGIFGSARQPGSGYALTSEGAAKAVSLLCGMEGIDCVICHDDDYGFYNKVRLSGEWYNVDVFGGKITGGALGAVQLMSHRGLLIGDSAMKLLGCTPDDRYEAYDVAETEYMQKRTYSGTYYDRYVDCAEADGYAEIRAAVYAAFDGTARGSFKLPFVGSETLYPQNTYGVELALDPDLTEAQINKVAEYINKAIDEYARNVLHATFVGRRTVIADGVVVAIAESPRAEE